MTDPTKEIRRLIDKRIAAIKAKDAAKALASLADDVVAFELAPPLSVPASAARDEAAFADWLDSFETIDVELRDLAIEADEHLGFGRALYRLSGTRTDGREVDMWMRSTLCFRREAGGWKIAHGHTSVPMMMDGSFKAAFNLTP